MMATRLWLRDPSVAPPSNHAAHFAEAAIQSLIKDGSP
jgi:hypothetical protein